MIVVWRISTQCNLACSFCAYDRRLPGARAQAQVGLVRRFAGVLGAYQRESGKPVLISWIGGEPLLWRPIFALSSQLVQEWGFRVSATTNGTTLHLPAVREQVLASFSELTVSVDGFDQLHDGLRGWRGGWQRLKHSVLALSRERNAGNARCKLRANIVVMHDNLPVLAELCEELADWGFDEITFNQLGGRDRPEFFRSHRLTPDDARTLSALVPALRERLAERSVQLCAGGQYLQRIEASALGQPLAVPDCGPGDDFLFIDERGRVSPCHFTNDELGIDLDELAGPQDLLALRARFRAARAARRPTVCSDCPSTQVFAKFAS